jgi:hypothetical protein
MNEEANNTDDSNDDNNNDSEEEEEADDNNDSEEENKAIDDNMPLRVKPSAASPPKKVKSPKKELGVANITAALKMQLKVPTPPPAKKFSLKTKDAYMVKHYTQKMLILLKLIFTLQGH